MSAKRSDKMLAELLAVVGDYLAAPEDDTDLPGRVRCWLEVAEGRVCASDSAGRLAGGPAPIDRARALVDLIEARGQATTTEVARLSDVCPETARLWLRKLAGRRVVRAVGSKKGRIYVAGINFADFAKTLDERLSVIKASDNTSDGREGMLRPAQASRVHLAGISEVVR